MPRMPADERIQIDPRVQHGKPVIRGTRVPVARLVGSLAGGMPPEQVAADYGVTVEDVRAALEYAERLIDEQQHYPLAG
jgi:uncharacterized protein (DUF433 family)